MRKWPNYGQYFGSNNVEGVTESWVEAEMSCVEVDGTAWMLVEVDTAGWRWVHSLVIPVYVQKMRKTWSLLSS